MDLNDSTLNVSQWFEQDQDLSEMFWFLEACALCNRC